ncbi:uncharacterized protein DSM5745_07529 [Aspergillus mulundensis]|uniref:Uncharacterized protein n=1 Tax=Aspergillus mulundensis TaxID=1810919 RepID=A0A3D8RE63_9EURO|nr:Uncharacterized protein DSM5745_07529 [Aspergillus mulundensis]RDW72357.1 Uncharacterized protein DSM5745_07529 [Aspergillus mulundensis]
MSVFIDQQPSTPGEWQTGYADLTQVKQIPGTSAEDISEVGNEETYRDIYLDGTPILQHPRGSCEIYADVLAFTTPEVTVEAKADTTIEIRTRVITASEPLHLNFSAAAAQSSAMEIYASILDQPIDVSVEGAQRTRLDIGAESKNVGAVIGFQNSKLTVSPLEQYGGDRSAVYQAHLDTQLRIALALFWARPAIALSICGHVARSTSGLDSGHALSNAQAVSLGQQLAGRRLAGKNAHYAPTLNFKNYRDTMEEQLDAAETFEAQYQLFQNAASGVDDHKKAWATMLANAKDQRVARASVQAQALDKYRDASATVGICTEQLDADEDEMEAAHESFRQGLEQWKNAQVFKAALGIFGAIFGFATGMADFATLGDVVQGVLDIEGAIQDVADIEDPQNGVPEDGQIISSGTMSPLWKCVKALGEIYPNMAALVEAAEQIVEIGDGDDVGLPSFGDVTGSQGSDADANLIVSIAAWDDWELQADEQMRWAVEEEDITGAGEYRLALRKHAVHGRALSQAQAEAIKQGQQYVQATLELHQLDKDIKNLQDLLDQYDGEEAEYVAAQAKFYDRYLRLQTTLAIQLQNIVDAYRFYTLEESKVTVDSQKSVGDFQENLATLQTEMDNLNGQFGQDPQPFKKTQYSDELASNFPATVIAGLRDSEKGNTATFTLKPVPNPTTTPGASNFAYPFVRGSHYRLEGMQLTLDTVKPYPAAITHGRALVSLLIETSGSYSDIYKDPEGETDKALTFVTQAQRKRYSYYVDAEGKFLEEVDQAIFPSTDHAEPPPFTAWKITFETAGDFDVSGLNLVEMTWGGRFLAYPDDRPMYSSLNCFTAAISPPLQELPQDQSPERVIPGLGMLVDILLQGLDIGREELRGA